ncbi:nucleotidyltransferase domain-containing protein, partial [Klebsiella aerogenes]|uniref:nucleotidyltransferase domain-containing protein n=2 Tax=Pseudomonadota TaxID=1224 RepID=UPI0013D53B02
MIDPTSSTPAEVLAAARAIVASRYPDAAFALVAGSLMRGEGTAHSDLDLIVLYDRIESSRRES